MYSPGRFLGGDVKRINAVVELSLSSAADLTIMLRLMLHRNTLIARRRIGYQRE